MGRLVFILQRNAKVHVLKAQERRKNWKPVTWENFLIKYTAVLEKMLSIKIINICKIFATQCLEKYWSVIRSFANGIVGNGLGNEPAFTEELTPQVLPLSHEHHSLYLSILQTSHVSLQRSVCSPSSEGNGTSRNLPASCWDPSPRFREKACLRGACGEWWERTAAPASGLCSQPLHLPHPNKLTN